MKPAPRSDVELLAWAASMIEREQTEKKYSIVSVHLEAGKITRARVERSERPGDESARLTEGDR